MVRSTAILFVVIALVTPSSPLPAAEPAPAADLSTREGEDWGTFLGPSGTGSSSLTGIASPWEASGPRGRGLGGEPGA